MSILIVRQCFLNISKHIHRRHLVKCEKALRNIKGGDAFRKGFGSFACAGSMIITKDWSKPHSEIETKFNRVVNKSDDYFISFYRFFIRLLEWIQTFFRTLKLIIIFSPLLMTSPVAYYRPTYRIRWFHRLKETLEYCGPIFIKLGQWASTRRDLFPTDLCIILSTLQRNIRPHPWKFTQKILNRTYGKEFEEIFESFDDVPIGSGCCAQVYRATLKRNKESVAVKILHPNLEKQFYRDLSCMKFITNCIVGLFPNLHWLSPGDFLDEFGKVMNMQIDLGTEINNLIKFRENFKDQDQISFPKPYQKLSRRDILVESFEEGTHISHFIGSRGTDRLTLADIGIEMLFKMLFAHNFVHGDLHPGNILVRKEDSSYKVIVIDPGIASSLSVQDLDNFRSVFKAVMTGDTETVGELFLDRSTHECQNREEFVGSMSKLVQNARSQQLSLSKLNVSELLNNVFSLLRDHRVKLDSNFCSVILAIMVLEGLGRSLNPELDLMSKALPHLIYKK